MNNKLKRNNNTNSIVRKGIIPDFVEIYSLHHKTVPNTSSHGNVVRGSSATNFDKI